MNTRQQKHLEKIFFAALGRKPDAFGIVPDKGGWISFKLLHRALIQEPGLSHLRLAGIKGFFAMFRPERFEWEEDRVRVKPEYQAPGIWEVVETEPPDRLYCPVRPRALVHTLGRGLGDARAERPVVLALTEEMAVRIGRFRDPAPVVVTVLAQKAWKAGVTFSRSGEELFLARHVIPAFLLFPPISKEIKKRERERDRERESAKKRKSRSPHPETQPAAGQAGAFVLQPGHIHGLMPSPLEGSGRDQRRARFERKRRGKKVKGKRYKKR